MRRDAALSICGLAALALGGCADAPETDQIAQVRMIGLSERDVLACLGLPARRVGAAQATEIWTYRSGVTTTDSPPWALGTDFSRLVPPAACDVRLVMTNRHVSQVAYAMPDGRGLPSGRQCSFPVWTCAGVAGAK